MPAHPRSANLVSFRSRNPKPDTRTPVPGPRKPLLSPSSRRPGRLPLLLGGVGELLEIVADGFVKTLGHAVFGDGSLGGVAGFGDRGVDLDAGFAAAVGLLGGPGGDDGTGAVLNIGGTADVVLTGRAFIAEDVGVGAGAPFLAADARALVLSSLLTLTLLRALPAGHLLHGLLRLTLCLLHLLKLLLHLAHLLQLLLGRPLALLKL